jgi:glutaredoxin
MKSKFFISLILVFSISLSVFANFVNAQTIAPIYFFWGEGCPHCAAEKIFLDKLKQENPNIQVQDFEVYKNRANLDLMIKIGEQTGADVRGVPLIIIGDQIIIGYLNESVTGGQIRSAVNRCLTTGCVDIVAPLIGKPAQIDPPPQTQKPAQPVDLPAQEPVDSIIDTFPEPEPDSYISDTAEDFESKDQTMEDKPFSEILVISEAAKTIQLPLIGELNLASMSLPVLTIALGALDGFNPCAMWVLVFLISLLLGMQNKRRMWILGSVFIIASGSVYFLFMAAWLNLILFIGFLFWLRLTIGMVALGGGAYNLREFFVNKENVCKVTGTEKRQRIFSKLKEITHRQSFWLALVGIIVLAAAVNIVELLCSAGLPVVFTQILALNNLPTWQYYAYILLYILIFILDDLIVFILAMSTLKMTGLGNKYARYSHLLGGAIMVIVGLMLIFKPEWLMFG